MPMEITFPGGKRVDARYHGFAIRTDQSKKNGGDASAPAPFHLFLASIGTCVGIYVLSLCQKRGIPTDKIRIVQDMERNADSGLIDRITLDIQLPPEFPDKYRHAVVRSAELCAVKKHLETPPQFDVSTSVAGA